MAITENQKRWAAKHRQNVRDYIKTAKGDICSDCKEKFPHYNLEFDHARGIYKFRIADAGARSLKSIKEEIEKCDVVCCNCHATRTWKRKNNLI